MQTEPRALRALEPLSANPEPRLAALQADSAHAGFRMASEPHLWELIRGLAASKPGRLAVETGAGTGLATFWILQGLSPDGRLISVESHECFQDIARKHLGYDTRLDLRLGATMDAIRDIPKGSVGMFFADAEPGKYEDLDFVLGLLEPGGIYIVDDIYVRPHWPNDFVIRPAQLLKSLYARGDGFVTVLEYGVGMALFTKSAN